LVWTEQYLSSDELFNLTLPQMEQLDELFYKNINFLNDYLANLKTSMSEVGSLKKFHQH
jgi:hypothetical protein